jgi:thymidylate synthase
MRFDLNDGFPLLTTKRINIQLIASELLWFLSGRTDVKSLNDDGNHIWDQWADADGNLGPVYGKQWRSWPGHNGVEYNQLDEVLDLIKRNPNSRRIIVSAWNVADLPDERFNPQENVDNGKMALAPCHVLFQFYVDAGRLSCQVYQRSADVFLGVPFNIASYALLTHLVAQQCGLQVGELIWTGGDIHLYNNHYIQTRTQLQRLPNVLPKLNILFKPATLYDYKLAHFEMFNYFAHPAIQADISV